MLNCQLMKYSVANLITFAGVLSKLPAFYCVVVTLSINIEVWGVPNVIKLFGTIQDVR